MSSPQRLIGQTIGKYKIVELLGRGGMAEVYKAYQESLDRYVAIKLMHAFLADEEDFLSRFQREARAMAALSHTNIVGVYDFDVQNGMYYIVMEFVGGGTLKQTLESMAVQGKQMPISHTVQIILEIADALAYAHSRGMVHRDIKPANIMINEDGRAVLTDFGIAKILSGPSFTATGAMIGTPAYMSPEQGLGQPGDERSDIYALGVLFFQMATGRLPFDADTPLAVILKHVNEPIPIPTELNADIPEAVHRVILKSLAKDPEERYQTANTMANDLRKAIRTSHLEMGAAVPLGLLQEKPTPPPMQTVPLAASGAAETVVASSSAPAGAEATQVAAANLADQTNIAAPPVAAPPETQKKRSRLPYVVAAIIILFIIGAIAGGIVLANIGGDNETPTSQPIVAGENTETPEPTTELEETSTIDGESTVRSTVDIGATANAAVAEALTAQAENQPTNTPVPSPTIADTPTPTPNMTATFLADCVPEIELTDYYTFQNQNSQAAPVDTDFLMNWVVLNSGTCPIPADSAWTYVEGEEFEQEGPVVLEEDLLSGEEVTIRSQFSAPSQPGSYESTWQLEDPDGSVIGAAQTFEILIFTPATPTPILPTATPTPDVTLTPVGEFSFNTSVFGCEYVGSDWRCQMSINVSGGVGPYTVFVFDANPPVEYRGPGPSFNHFFQSRRCNAWIHEVRVQDDGTGQSISQNQFIDPDLYFPNGCSETDP